MRDNLSSPRGTANPHRQRVWMCNSVTRKEWRIRNTNPIYCPIGLDHLVYLNSGQQREVFRSQRSFIYPDAAPNNSTSGFSFLSEIDLLALLKSSHTRNLTENCRNFPPWLAQKARQCRWLPEMQMARLTSIEIRSFISNSKLTESSWNLIFVPTCVKMHIQVWTGKITKLPFSEMARALWDILFRFPFWRLELWVAGEMLAQSEL